VEAVREVNSSSEAVERVEVQRSQEEKQEPRTEECER